MLRALGLVTASLAVTTGAFAANTLTSMASVSEAVLTPSATAAMGRANTGEYFWLAQGRPTAFAREAVALLSQAPSHGISESHLGPPGFSINRLRELSNHLSMGRYENAEFFDQQLSRAWTNFIAAMRPSHAVSTTRDTEKRQSATLLETTNSGGPRIMFTSLVPTHPQYGALQIALKAHESGEIEYLELPAGPKLEAGDFDPRIMALRTRLLGRRDRAYGDYDRSYFDSQLTAAVIEYQRMHGLDADGIVGPRTIEHLNMSIAERIARIKVNMARWRELPTEFGPDYVQVNIPEFRLQMIRNGEERLSMRVVVGSKRHQTPEFSEEIEYLVFNPYWYVPRSIAVDEILPNVKANPAYLASNGYEVFADGHIVSADSIDWQQLDASNFNLKFRQRSGAGNALGSVKFLMPNPMNIYLHDSPSRHLYGRSIRAFSHGCIRLEYPHQFAEAVLEQHNEWTAERLDSIIQSGARKQVNLDATLPVHLTYMTVKVAESGEVAFFNDVYGRDQSRVARYL